MRVLIVDEDDHQCRRLADCFATEGHCLSLVGNLKEAIDRIQEEGFDVILADADIRAVGGLNLLKRAKRESLAGAEIVMMSAKATIPLAVQVTKLGAFDFVTKPLQPDQVVSVLARIEREAANTRRRDDADDMRVAIDREVIGSSEPMARVKRLAKVAARTDANVLLCGETGVGKDLLAAMIHRQSHRSRGPFVKVGCATFPSTLVENELYGHEQGAFTGADQLRPGRFESAEGGTIYLDDVDDIPLEHQAKLLRAIEEKVFERVGGTALIKANVRIIASTKLNLLDKVSDGTFRQDLYYRLDVLRVRIAPLRNRREDIPELAEHLFRRIVQNETGQIDQDAIRFLTQHDWPGNVRELYHALERAWLVGGGHITAELLQAEMEGFGMQPSTDEGSLPASRGFKAAMDHAEKQLLLSALEASGGNKTAAAHSLAMKPSTFRDKLAKHKLS